MSAWILDSEMSLVIQCFILHIIALDKVHESNNFGLKQLSTTVIRFL